MSSRILRAGDRFQAQSMVWRQVGGPPQPRHPVPGGDSNHPEPFTADYDRRMEARVQAAYQKGQAAGEAAGLQRASQRLEPAIDALSRIVHELAGTRKRFRTEAEEDTVKLAIAIARRVLHRELSTDPEAILGLVMAAFQKLNTRETHRLRVSPATAAILEQNRARLELPVGLEIVPEGSLADGAAVFETSRGELDASIDTQLTEIQRGLADVIRRRAQ
jgi:flagellar assembly protein FliH